MNANLREEELDACLHVLYRALVAIRMAGWAGDTARCTAIADALHNLPDLMRDGDRRGWTVEQFAELFLDPLIAGHAEAAEWRDALLRASGRKEQG